MANTIALPNRQAVRNAVGRANFSVKDLVEATGVARNTAKSTVDRLVAEGLAVPTGSRKHTNEDGTPGRGRPEHLFALLYGSKA